MRTSTITAISASPRVVEHGIRIRRSSDAPAMGFLCRRFAVLVVVVTLVVTLAGPERALADKTFSMTQREYWTGSRIHGTPDPPDRYTTEDAFPGVRFDSPLAVCSLPGTNLFVVAERRGKLFTLDQKSGAQKSLLTDLGRTIYGIAAHPDFQRTGWLFVTTIVTENAENGSRLSRFHVSRNAADGRLVVDADSETVLLEWLAGGHNGGCLQFGPDGFLFMVTGDGSGWADLSLTGQRIDDLLASMLRIDVDHPSADRNYSIPADNPFVDHPTARPEVYSYGHRNIWKFSFDHEGRLWAGDVGQDLWEYILRIEKGGNYGWSVTEGSHSFRPDRDKGPTPILTPVVEHPHSDFRSITGGIVSRSPDQPELLDHYIYGDYDTGKIWSFRFRDNVVSQHRQLADTQLRVISFAQDHQGRVFVVDFVSGTIRKLVPAPQPQSDAPVFPRRLSETGLFASTKDHIPAAGLIPYSVNAPLWSDGATKDRLIALPGNTTIEFDAVTYPMPAPGWRFPDGTVMVKTFSMAMDSAKPNQLRRLETRILHHRRMPGEDNEYGAQVWNGYTYVWNDDQTDAELLDAQGLDRELSIRDASAAGGIRKQVWHFPSRTECTLCHTMSAKYVLGVNTFQMNRTHDYGGGVSANQLTVLEQLGVFDKKLPQPSDQLSRLADPEDTAADVEARARSYLHANCSHCHRIWGGGNADFQIQADLSLDKTQTLGFAPIRGDFGLPGAMLVAPGKPDSSLLLHRMTLTGLGRMPHVASNRIDDAGVRLVRDWIGQMQGTESPPK